MNYSNIGIFSMMKTMMAYTHERQDMLSKNIANIDTPGYRAEEMKAVDFKKIMSAYSRKIEMKTSSAMHQEPRFKDQDFRSGELRKPFEATPTENSVVLEEQMAKVADNQMTHSTVTNMYQKMTSMFKTALG